MMFRVIFSCFRGTAEARGVNDFRLDVAAGSPNSAQPASEAPDKALHDITYAGVNVSNGDLGTNFLETPTQAVCSWGAAASLPERAAVLPAAHIRSRAHLPFLQSGSHSPQLVSRDSLICAHVPAAITVFNLDGAPVHQNPTSVMMYGPRAPPPGSPSACDAANLLNQIFALQPEKLQIMWHEVMRVGAGHWKGIIRVPSLLLLPRPPPHEGATIFSPAAAAAAAAAGAHPATPTSAPNRPRRGWDHLTSDSFALSLDGSPRLVMLDAREDGGAGGADVDADGDGDEDGDHGRAAGTGTGSRRGGCGACSPSSSPPAAAGAAAAVKAVVEAAGTTGAGSGYGGGGGGVRLYDSLPAAPGLSHRTRTDGALMNGRASPRRLRAPLVNGGRLGRRQLSAHSLRMSPTGPMGSKAASSGEFVAPLEPQWKPDKEPSASCAAHVCPSEVQYAPRCNGEGPQSSTGPCTATMAMSGFAVATNSDLCSHQPTSTHSTFKHHSLPDNGYARPVVTTVTGRISTLGAHPTRQQPAPPNHASTEASTSSWKHGVSGGGGGGLAAAAGGGMLHVPTGAKPPCPLGFDLGEIPESVGPDALGSFSRGWDSTFNPLATSTFGLTLGATFDGLPEAATPASALTSVVASGAASAGAGALGPARVLDLAAARRPSYSLRGLTSARAISGSAGVHGVAAAAAATAATASTAAITATGAFAIASARSPQGGSGQQQHQQQHRHNRKPARTNSGSVGASGGSSFSRVLTFASSLRNAPVATQILAEASRPGSGGGGGGPPRALSAPKWGASSRGLLPASSEANAATAAAAAGGPEGQHQQQQAAPVAPVPCWPPPQRPQPEREGEGEGREMSRVGPSAVWVPVIEGEIGPTTVAEPPCIDGADAGGKPGPERPAEPLEAQPKSQKPPQGPGARPPQGSGEGRPVGSPAQATGPNLPTVDWPVQSSICPSSSSSLILLTPSSSEGDGDGAEGREAAAAHERTDQQGPPGPPPGASAGPGFEEALQGAHPPAECWHEVWATRAVDPVTGGAVLVLAQHDVSAKVIAERHLALVMEAEHRLLEQLFPKHILTHVTEEWIAEAERAEAAEARHPAAPTAPPRGTRWRPVIRDCNGLATWHPEVTLLFADIKGFTPMCKVVTPREVMTMLNSLFSRFDALLDKFGVFKVETIGDCYFVAGGLICEDEDGMAAVRDGESRGDPLHAQKVFMFAKAMLAAAREVRMPSSGEPVQIRIGISSGPVVSGVVGTRMPRFCLFGDTVNTTSRMESTGQPGAIHASESAFALLRSEAWEPTGGIEVKGKGLMKTYLWRPLLEEEGEGQGTARRLPLSYEEAATALMQAAGSERQAAAASTGTIPAGGN